MECHTGTVGHLLGTIFVRKTACQKYLFQILSPKNVQIVNLKNPDLDSIRRIHPECGFYRFMIRCWICQKNAKSVFGFGNPDLNFPQKNAPKRNLVTSLLVTKKPEGTGYEIALALTKLLVKQFPIDKCLNLRHLIFLVCALLTRAYGPILGSVMKSQITFVQEV